MGEHLASGNVGRSFPAAPPRPKHRAPSSRIALGRAAGSCRHQLRPEGAGEVGHSRRRETQGENNCKAKLISHLPFLL